MKSLYKYFTVNGSRSNKIILFDVDDTLIHTTAGIWIKKNGKYIKHITNQEYNDYRLEPGEEFDFKEFSDPKLLDNEQLTSYWNTLVREYKKGSHIGIITARGNCNMIRKFLLKKGIDIKKELVFATDDPKLGLSGTVQQRKAEVISILYKYGYTKFIFFDDNKGNLESAKALEKIFGIDVITINV